jgi:hypothetical protein
LGDRADREKKNELLQHKDRGLKTN